MTRRIIGFVLDSFLLFLVALFIYRYRRLLKKNRVTIAGSGLTWPDELHLKTIACLEEYKGTFTPTPDLGLVPTNIPCDTGGDIDVTLKRLAPDELVPDNRIWFSGDMGGVGVTIYGSGRHVPGRDCTSDTEEWLKFGKKDDVTDRREEDDNYYDERE